MRLLLALFLSAATLHAETRRVILIAGPKDQNHPAGTHEYEKSLLLLKHCLDHSPDTKDLATEAHFNGWPADSNCLNEANTIVLICSGADRNVKDHPFLVGSRMDTIDRQLKRGCGLVVLHWGVFVPNKPEGDRFLEWIGGHFDYQSGPAPKGWSSKITTATMQVRPLAPKHPILAGVEPTTLKEEYYHSLRFRTPDARRTDILAAEVAKGMPAETVAWAVERADTGRGFGYTGSHFYDNWNDANIRTMVLNAIAWTARAPVPERGVKSVMPTEAELRKVVVGKVDGAWTPPGGDEAKLKQTEADWVDDRLRKMDTGPSWNATFEYFRGAERTKVYKGTALRLGKPGDAAVLFDRNRLQLVAGWTGEFLTHSNKRFGLLNTPSPAGTMLFTSTAQPGWRFPAVADAAAPPATAPLPKVWGQFVALHRHDGGTVLEYRVGSMTVYESHEARKFGSLPTILRSFTVSKCDHASELVLGIPGTVSGDGKTRLITDGKRTIGVRLLGNAETFRVATDGLRLQLPASDQPRSFTIAYTAANDAEQVKTALAEPTVAERGVSMEPSPNPYPTLTTVGKLGTTDGPFALDTLTIPFENPWKALFFTSGLDFLPDGRIAVCTAHGDVWLVTPNADLSKITWQRFATGLYQPLGLKVVDGKIHVIERGQITRLSDLNGDGYADRYENFADGWHTGSGEHSYDSCLETDPAGNFYTFKCGDPETPTGGCLLRIPTQGGSFQIFATGFRHATGLGITPDGRVIGADQEGNWMPATRLDLYREGGFYGDMRTHHRKTPPTTYDLPLLWLPRSADNSAGGQVAIPVGKFGELGGHTLHFSYGRCQSLLVLPQYDGERFQGAAIELPVIFRSGVMRGRFSSADDAIYACGLKGWQTTAADDGCLQRLRLTGKPTRLPTEWTASGTMLTVKFAEPIDAASVKIGAFELSRWNYAWSGVYGSRHWSLADPKKEGHDPVEIASAELDADGKTVRLRVPDLKPAMQMRLDYTLKGVDGGSVSGKLYQTVHWTK